jgi:hypothetical protein
MEGLRVDLEPPSPRSSNQSRLEKYSLALVATLELAARTGGRPAFDDLFDRGFDRVYAWSYRIERNRERAQALASEILLGAARALSRRAAEAGVTAVSKRMR